MTRRTLLVRALDGRDMLAFEGEDLAWGDDPDQKAWRGFDRMRLLLGDGGWISFDAGPAPGIEPPSGVPPHSCIDIIRKGALETVPGAPHIRRLRHRYHLRASFHWPNPLTPAGAGLWFQLEFQAWKSGGPIVLLGGRQEGNGSAIWHSAKRSPSGGDWEKAEGDPICAGTDGACDQGRIAFDAFADREIEYCDWTGDDPDHLGALIDGAAGSDAWVVDLTRRKRRTYRLGPREPAAGAAQQLIARLSLSERDTAGAPVSSRALGGVSAMLDHSTLAARSVDLSCARAAAAGGHRWVLDWKIPSDARQERRDTLSLPSVWRQIASHYPIGLSAARARNRFTLVPTRLASADDPRPATIRFEVGCDADGAALRTRLRQLSIGIDRALTASFGGAQQTDGSAPVIRLSASDRIPYRAPGSLAPVDGPFRTITEAAAQAEPFSPSCVAIAMTGAGSLETPIDWVVGGARVGAAVVADLALRFTLEPRGELVERCPLGCDVALDFRDASLAPAAQDPEPGFETLSAWLDRPRPISIDMAEAGAPALHLLVTERASAAQSRLLRIQARTSGSSLAGRFDSDVVVIDPSPLTIARVTDVRRPPEGDLLAEYSDDSETPAGWEFSTGTGEMTIILPPQSIGEEMIKGRLALPSGVEIPLKNLPFGYRLGANAVLRVDRTDIDTARAPPPWMLRRHLARRTGVTGLKLDGAAFELVYGLTTTVATKGLRIAELDALIGRIPFADPLAAIAKGGRGGPSEGAAPDRVRQAYAETQGRWILDLLHRQSWWPLFRDIGDRRQLVLRDDVDVALRPTRETAHPFAIDRLARDRDEQPARPPLRGGVDWLFQSPNIYDEFIGAPESVDAMIEGVAFGPLGGEGNQSAHFANGKTIVVSRTRQGHLESLVLMRIGRIAMLWNRARHVIVYQRTSRRAPRYEQNGVGYQGDTYDKQRDGFDGFMALRKVREYIEITQPRRRFPDFPTELPLTGPCLQSSVETVIIPVKASWAQDIDRGQIIPLSGPMDEDERRHFPRPRIFLEFARADEKGGGLIASEVADPGQLFFFTSTRPQDGKDSDRWPAWPDVDYPLIAPAGPSEVGFRPHFTGARRQPDAARAEIGQSRFTIDVIPNEEAANLMHGRQPQAIEARISSVSLARGRPPIAVPPQSLHATLAAPLSAANAIISEKLTELRDQAKAHAARVTDAASPEHRQFVTEAKTLLDQLAGLLSSAPGTLIDQFRTHPGIGTHSGKWIELQMAAADHYVTNVAAEMGAAAAQVEAVIDRIAAAGFDEAKRLAAAAIETLARQAAMRVEQVTYLPDQALGRLETTIDLVERELAAGLAAARASIRDAVVDARAGYEANKTRAVALHADWRRAVLDAAARVQRIDESLPGRVSETLGPLFAGRGAGSIHERLVASLRTVLRPIPDAIEQAIATVPSFGDDSDWDALERMAGDLIPPLQVSFDEIVAALRDAAGTVDWRQPVTAALARIDALRQAVVGSRDRQALDKALAQAKAAFGLWAAGDALTGLIHDRLLQIGGAAELEALAGQFDAARAFVDDLASEDWLKALTDALDKNDIAAMARDLDRQARALADGFASAVKQAEHAIVENLKDELRAAGRDLLAETVTPTLELGRALATGIVTDTLGCTRDQLGYYYRRGEQMLDVTRASAILNDLGRGNLNALSAVVPFDRLRDRLMPQLENIDYSSLFPDFAGLKLEHLFPELRVIKDALGEYDWLTIRHGFDKDRLTAWSDVAIDKSFEEAPVLFALPPLTLSLGEARLTAHSRLEIGADGARVQEVSGSILADWTLSLGGKPVVTMRRAALRFGNDGSFDFDFESENIVLAPELKFITDALAQLVPQEEGLTIAPALPAGISAALALPLPDLGTGAFTITGVTLHTHFGLLIDDRFTVRTGFWLSKPDRPFGLAILFLGGGGWVGVEASYSPPGRFVTRVSIGISAGAFVALNLGFARASAGLLFTAGVDYYNDGRRRGSTAISLGLLIWGDFSILSIAHAYLQITARVTYTSEGGMTASGRVEVKIRISFFYTLRLSRRFERRFSGKRKKQQAMAHTSVLALSAVQMEPLIAEAIALHFLTLDLPR